MNGSRDHHLHKYLSRLKAPRPILFSLPSRSALHFLPSKRFLASLEHSDHDHVLHFSKMNSHRLLGTTTLPILALRACLLQRWCPEMQGTSSAPGDLKNGPKRAV